MAAYLLNHNILENITNSVYLILYFEMAMYFNLLHFTVTRHIKLKINPCTVWPDFKSFKNIVIWEIILQEIEFFISLKYFDILTFSVTISNVSRVDLHSLILENRRQIHEIKFKCCDWGDKRPCLCCEKPYIYLAVASSMVP